MSTIEREILTGDVTSEERKTAEHLLELAKKPVIAPDSAVQKGKVIYLAEAARLKQQLKK